jgi:formiminoglutamate deiminase
MTRYICESAVLPDGSVAADVVVAVEAGRIVAVTPGGEVGVDTERLGGLVVPGAANAHSHAFHRALRGRTHGVRGSFWTWREQMYELAAGLDPDGLHRLARAVFAEMALAGFTSVGEFHYLHHQADGSPYADPNELGHALLAAAREAGVRITLLDACYLTGGFGRALEGVQRRFGDGDSDAWARRVEALDASVGAADDVVIGAAIHSVRAVPREQLPTIVAWAADHDVPIHAHVSEQPAENTACLEATGRTPTQLLADVGMLGARATAVHATHLTAADLAALGESRSTACLCPTTERDLADGVGAGRALLDAGAALALGTDSHAVIDAFEEARAVELDLRLTTLERGHLTGGELLRALTVDGQASLGFGDAGRLEVGARADLVAVDLSSVRTAGADAEHAVDTTVFGAAASDVTDVIVDGQRVVRDRSHQLGDVGRLLGDAIRTVVGGARS